MCLNSQNHVIYAIRAKCRAINFNFKLSHGAKESSKDSIKIQNTIRSENLHATLFEPSACDGETKASGEDFRGNVLITSIIQMNVWLSNSDNWFRWRAWECWEVLSAAEWMQSLFWVERLIESFQMKAKLPFDKHWGRILGEEKFSKRQNLKRSSSSLSAALKSAASWWVTNIILRGNRIIGKLSYIFSSRCWKNWRIYEIESSGGRGKSLAEVRGNFYWIKFSSNP